MTNDKGFMKLHRLTRMVGHFALYLLYLILYTIRMVKPGEKYHFSKNVGEEEALFALKSRTYHTDRLFIIDDDPGMYWDAIWKGHYALPWLRLMDPDGGFELLYALRDQNARVIGITTMMGVSATSVGMRCAKRILNLLGIEDVPVLKGATHPRELGTETEAARFIVDAVMAHPGKVHIVATGPLTNIATALMIKPDLPQYWGALHFATGEFRGALGVPSDLFLPSLIGIPDLNTNVDVSATHYVLEHGGPFPIYPNEIMDDLYFTRADYAFVKNAGTRVGNFIAYETRVYNFLFNLMPFSKGMIPHGVPPTAIALDPTYRCQIIESAVILKNFGHQGFAFQLSKNPNLPKHKIYIQLSAEARDRMHRTLLRRCI
ncbi:MAG: nucleoside hydrolase [Candidatus Helarchaeota archaeon]